MRVTEQRSKHTTRTLAGRSTTMERSLNVNALCQLGWGILYFRRLSSSRQSSRGVHNLGLESQYINTSSQLAEVSTTLDTIPCTQIYQASKAEVSTTLDINPRTEIYQASLAGVSTLWTQFPVHKYIKPVRLRCPELWT